MHIILHCNYDSSYRKVCTFSIFIDVFYIEMPFWFYFLMFSTDKNLQTVTSGRDADLSLFRSPFCFPVAADTWKCNILSTFSLVPLMHYIHLQYHICSIDNFTHIVLYRWWWLGVKQIQKFQCMVWQ
jgi:hypothetical protein